MNVNEFKNLVYLKLCQITDGVKGREIYSKIDDSMWNGIVVKHNSLTDTPNFKTSEFVTDISRQIIKMFGQPSEDQTKLNEDVKNRLLRIKDGYLDMAIANPQVSDDMKFLADIYLNNRSDIFFDLLPVPALPEQQEEKVPKKESSFYKIANTAMLVFLSIVALVSIL